MDVLDKGVEISFGVAFLLVSFSGDSDSDFVGEVPDALSPDKLVEFGVDPHIGGSHHLGDQGFDLLDGSGGLLLEGSLVGQFVDVDGCVDCGFSQAGSLFLLHHRLLL